jgi:hypothetical protein
MAIMYVQCSTRSLRWRKFADVRGYRAESGHPDHLLLSVLGTAIVNMILAINHKPGRYRGVT